ncbi:AAA family ATPase [Oxalobacteraceae bacterium R-40]|uniref:AAA family ATPase n=1 Tax=Keguizhuia sedimenti TaxID=3064264 RepID=A0ABU1BIH1_9BURK|nr:AAA family ATPase [Oxalobacteraceae bacterium R-40]
MEPLQVALELTWKLCEVEFVDGFGDSKERTGGVRYLKNLKFSVYMDLLNELLTDLGNVFLPDVFNLLLSWLDNKSSPGAYEEKLLKVLTVLTEDTHFALRDGPGGAVIEFQQEGIYNALETNSAVDFGTDEKKGPLRILNSIVSDNLHPYLISTSSGIGIRPGATKFGDYVNRVSHYLNIVERPQSVTIAPEEDPSEEDSEGLSSGAGSGLPSSTAVSKKPSSFPWNWIVYGAPGTGKSHFVDEERIKLAPDEEKRVIFYSDYTYAHFVGGYRPAPLYDPSAHKDYLTLSGTDAGRPGKPIIEYKFVPGPLLELIVKAIKDSSKTYLLIIEELNRADAPAVFGDVFQLLDRKPDGSSKYPVRLSTEATEYLISQGIGPSITIPGNLYIWATMNNADQGVMPLDTAFKRRWQFRYMRLNEGAHVVDSYEIQTKFLATSGSPLAIKWNDLRQKINAKLSQLRIHEDMHIGPFFFKESETEDDKAFQFKLLSYLRDDILRHRADEFFTVPGATLSDLLEQYEKGENIFDFTLE